MKAILAAMVLVLWSVVPAHAMSLYDQRVLVWGEEAQGVGQLHTWNALVADLRAGAIPLTEFTQAACHLDANDNPIVKYWAGVKLDKRYRQEYTLVGYLFVQLQALWMIPCITKGQHYNPYSLSGARRTLAQLEKLLPPPRG